MFSPSTRAHIVAVLTAVLTTGCAGPTAPLHSTALGGTNPPVDRLPRAPYIVADARPLAVVGPTREQRENYDQQRREFDRSRQDRIDSRRSAELDKRSLTEDCIIQTLIIFSPICIVVVPLAAGARYMAVSAWAAAKEPYMPGAVSDADISQLGNTVRTRLSAAAIAIHLQSPTRPETHGRDGFPRLLVRAETATFTAHRTITISFAVQAQPAAGEIWPETLHRYMVGYGENINHPQVGADLAAAETALAQSIRAAYRWD